MLHFDIQRDLTPPYVDDGLIEVVGFRDAWHGLVLLAPNGHGTRLAQVKTCFFLLFLVLKFCVIFHFNAIIMCYVPFLHRHTEFDLSSIREQLIIHL